MLNFLFSKEVSYIVIIGWTMLGGLVNIIRQIAYQSYIKESSNVGQSKNKYIYELLKNYFNKKNVKNVDNFVDKCMYKLKFCGFKLYTWDKLCGQNIVIVIAISVILSVLAGYRKCGQDEILLTILIGMLCTAVLIIVNMTISSQVKKNIIYFNIVDYLYENKGNDVEQAKVLSIDEAKQSQPVKQREKNKNKKTDKIERNTVKQNVNQDKRDIIKKAFTDAVYEAAMEKISNQNTNISHNDKENEGDKPLNKQGTENEVIEAFLKEMLQQ